MRRPSPPFVVHPARRILTMSGVEPLATAVAIRDGRILGVGDEAMLAGWGAYRVDNRYAERVLMPGLVEVHSHLLEGGMWDYPYVGFYPRQGPDGRRWPACGCDRTWTLAAPLRFHHPDPRCAQHR